MVQSKKQLVFILLGPTAVGKTDVSLKLAEECNFQIVSADSMQVYRHLDIGTAKPTQKDILKIKHHMIDIVDPDEEYNVADYYHEATGILQRLSAEGQMVLVVGGAGMYLKRLLEGVFHGPGSDLGVRRHLQKEARDIGNAAMHDKLKQVDSKAAGRIHPNNIRRVIRALEVYELTGQALSELQESQPEPEDFRFVKIGLQLSKTKLYERIAQRTDDMFERGFIEEVRWVQDRFCLTDTIRKSIGYRDVLRYIEKLQDLEYTKDAIKKATRLLVKKQLTWFGNNDSIHWFCSDQNPSREIFKFIKQEYSRD